MRATRSCLYLAALLVALCPPRAAQAALGGAATQATDQTSAPGARLKFAVRQGTSASWRVQDVTLDSGTVVHEYIATATGKVFAVSWSGRSLPDLEQFLGDYYSRYRGAARTPAIRHRLVRLQDGDLVIQSAGHARRFEGHAFLPGQLPSGFTADDIS